MSATADKPLVQTGKVPTPAVVVNPIKAQPVDPETVPAVANPWAAVANGGGANTDWFGVKAVKTADGLVKYCATHVLPTNNGIGK